MLRLRRIVLQYVHVYANFIARIVQWVKGLFCIRLSAKV